MQFNGATCNNKQRTLAFPGSQWCQHKYACVGIPCACGLSHCVQEAFSSGLFCNCFSVAAHRPGSLLPPPFPPSFHCFDSVMGTCSSYCVGAHGWVARIYQPCEQSSSRSWLPIVEAAGCLRHPTSILAIQLLTNFLLSIMFAFVKYVLFTRLKVKK